MLSARPRCARWATRLKRTGVPIVSDFDGVGRRDGTRARKSIADRRRQITEASVTGNEGHLLAKARILGGIAVHDHSLLGVNRVMLRGVPDGATALGWPTRMREMQEDLLF